MADGVVLLRPLLCQQHLGLSIVLLLPPVGAHRVAAMVPDHRCRAETQGPAALLQPPADIDIVASNTELRIESTYRFEVGFTKCHVTAWNVFRFLIRKENVDRAAWSIGDTIGDWPVARGCDVRTAYPGVLRAQASGRAGGQPG